MVRVVRMAADLMKPLQRDLRWIVVAVFSLG